MARPMRTIGLDIKLASHSQYDREPPRPALLSPMGEEIVGATGGAKLTHLNPLYAKLDQLTPVGLPEVEVKGAVPLGPKEPLPMIEPGFHQLYHLSPDLVATGPDARTQASYDVGGAAAVGFHHG